MICIGYRWRSSVVIALAQLRYCGVATFIKLFRNHVGFESCFVDGGFGFDLWMRGFWICFIGEGVLDLFFVDMGFRGFEVLGQYKYKP